MVGHVGSELSTETIRTKAQLLPGEADTHAENNVEPDMIALEEADCD